jgi:superfamily I DNA/RNA helicase/RecB family exonuclease
VTSYRLVRPSAAPVEGPALDPFQQSVVDHERGPLLVLAGPGTGKTTTLVEAIVDRIERQGVAPESVLALTFSRKAAEQLRDRVTARLGRTMATTLSSTFHSFAYGLIRAFEKQDLYSEPLRLLSAPEQDVQLRELLEYPGAAGAPVWPEGLRAALGTRGFAAEVQTVLARAREKGLDPEDLVRIGREESRPAWVASGLFMEEYLRTLDFRSALDYPELIHRAALLAELPEVRRPLRAQYSWVFVDEYQDTDPRQVALLQALAGDGRNLVAVGDPDQSIYAFRGAEVRGILDFPAEFPRLDGRPAEVVALRTTRRFGSRLLRASRSVARSIPTRGAIDAELFQAFRHPQPVAGEYGAGEVDVLRFATPRAETDHIADILRRAHLEQDIPWSQMAVLVRSGRTSIPSLRRALLGAGVPVEVAGDELPLAQEPSVAPLLSCLRAVVEPEALTVEGAHALLASPLGGLDATEIRVLARELRAVDREQHLGERLPLPSGQLLRRAVLEPGMLQDLPGRPASKAHALAMLITRAGRELRAGRTAEEVLWTLWEGTSWKWHLRSAVDRGGAAARLAHRDLDAVCALFEVAARTEEKQGHTSVAAFLAELSAQQIPGDTLAERGVRGESVRLLTAHRSKGLEWRLVVVAGVQEGSWPNLQQRGSLLEADRIGPHGAVPQVTRTELLAEERRLFYVACTRARERLVVTAVASAEDEGDQPSRFLSELGVPMSQPQGRPARPLSLAGLVAELRRTASDPDQTEAMRRAAASRLAVLAAAEKDGEPLVPQADPGTWWGMRSRSVAPQPLRPADAPLSLSASALDGLLSCPVRWFLDREAAGGSAQSSSQGFGLVVHALADRVGKGEISDVDDLIGHVDRIWDSLLFDTPWARDRQRGQVHDVIRRFVNWHNRPGARTFLASEQAIEAEVRLPDGETVALRGFADRLELTADGAVVVVDFKTSKRKPTEDEVVEHPQLGLYQLAVDHGAVAGIAGPGARSGGAELVMLRLGEQSGAGEMPKVASQAPQEPDAEGRRLVELQLMTAAEVVRSERLAARENRYCGYCEFTNLCPVKGSGTVL